MKRMQIIGLALVAVFAMSAIASSAASAAPKWFECKKETTAKFVYTEAKCKTKSTTTPPTGEFERHELAAPVTFTGTSGAGKLVSSGGTIECASDTVSEGSIAAPSAVTQVKVLFEKCKSSGIACHTGASGENIETNKLSGQLVYLKAGATDVGVQLKPISPATEFTKGEVACSFIKVKVTKEILGEVQPQNETNTAGKLIYEENAAKTLQRWRQVEEVGGIVELEAFGGPARLTTTEALTFVTAVGVA